VKYKEGNISKLLKHKVIAQKPVANKKKTAKMAPIIPACPEADKPGPFSNKKRQIINSIRLKSMKKSVLKYFYQLF